MDRGWLVRFAAYMKYLIITKICNSADEYVFPMLNINNSSANVRLILLLLSHLLKSPIRF